MKAKVRYTSDEIVWFVIKGAKTEEHRLREDGGLVGAFMKWLCDQPFYAAVNSLSGGGMWIGGFFPADAPKVQAWLDAHGAEEDLKHAIGETL